MQQEVKPGLENNDEILDRIATGLYNLAAMLVGEGETSAELVEQTVSSSEVKLCCCPIEARKSSKRVLSGLALRVLAERDPESLRAPEGPAPAGVCIEEDDLEEAGFTYEQIESIFSGPERGRVRTWLEGLKPTVRIVFVLRAVACLTAAEASRLLKINGGKFSMSWTPEAVRECFRQGLCSLASQIFHAAPKEA